MTQEEDMIGNPQEQGRSLPPEATRNDKLDLERSLFAQLLELSRNHPRLTVLVAFIFSALFPQLAHAQEYDTPPEPRAGANHLVLSDVEQRRLDQLRIFADASGHPDAFQALIGQLEAEIGAGGDGGDGGNNPPELITPEIDPPPQVTATTLADSNSNVRTSPETGTTFQYTINGSVTQSGEVVLMTDPAELAAFATLEATNVHLNNDGTYYLENATTGTRWEIQQDSELHYYYVQAGRYKWYLMSSGAGFTPRDPNSATVICEIRIAAGSLGQGTEPESEPTPDSAPNPEPEGTIPSTETPAQPQPQGTQPADTDPPVQAEPTQAPPAVPEPAPEPRTDTGTVTPPTEVVGGTELIPTENPASIMSGELGQMVTPTWSTDVSIFYLPENMYGRQGDIVTRVEYDFTPEEARAGINRWLAEIYHNLLVGNETDVNGVAYTTVLGLSSDATIPQILDWIIAHQDNLPLIPYRYEIGENGSGEQQYRTGFADPNQTIEFYAIPANMRPAISATGPTPTPPWMELTQYATGLSSGQGLTVDRDTGQIRIFFAPSINTDVYWTDAFLAAQTTTSYLFSDQGEYPHNMLGTPQLTVDLAQAWGTLDDQGNFLERATVSVN